MSTDEIKEIKELKNWICIYNDSSPENKQKLLDNMKNTYMNYSNLVELFPKIKTKNIDKYVQLIKYKHKNGKSRNEILDYYNRHSGLIEFLLDCLGIINNDNDNDNIPIQFEWKNNQKRGITSSINSNFISGIHSQATGSGKSLMALKIMWEYHKRNKKDNLMWLCERQDIPQKLFFKIHKDKKNNIIVKDKTNIFKFWKDNDIIDMGDFIIKEYVYNKDKNWISDINKTYNKPLFIIINRAFLTGKSKERKFSYKYEELKNIPKFIILDECHSATSSRTYELLLYCKDKWFSKIQGLSATPYRKGKSQTEFKTNINDESDIELNTTNNLKKLKNIFGKPDNNNELNILSWFNLKEAIETNCILEPVFHWYNIKEYQKQNNVEHDEKEIYSVLGVLNNIISSTSSNTYYNMRYKKIIVWCRLIDVAKKWYTMFKKYKNLHHNLSNLKMFIDYSNVKTDFPPVIVDNKEVGYYYDEFYESQDNSIMFCAAKFREGSDIPFLSCALFLDKVKNRGEVPFIQCIGRVLRKEGNKNCGHIIDGYVNSENNTQSIIDKLLKYYIDLYEITKSRFILDDEKKENIEILTKSKIELYNEICKGLDIQPEENKIYIRMKNNKKITIDLGNIKMQTIKWNNIISKFNELMKSTIVWSDYDEYVYLKSKVKQIGIVDKKDYADKINDYKVLNGITNPEDTYKDYWVNWYIFLGIDTSKFIDTKEKWIIYCNKKNVNSLDDYNNLCKRKSKLPVMPEEYYDDFTDIRNELGLRPNVIY